MLIEGKVPKEFKKVSFPEERKLSKSLNYYPLLSDKELYQPETVISVIVLRREYSLDYTAPGPSAITNNDYVTPFKSFYLYEALKYELGRIKHSINKTDKSSTEALQYCKINV